MSEVPPLMRSGSSAALKAIFAPSGDHSNPPTVNAFPPVRRRPGWGERMASSTSTVQRWVWVYSRRTTS